MKAIAFTLSILFSAVGFSQLVTNIQDIKVDVDFDNVYVKKLDTDSNSSTFIIWIKNGVKSHKHLEHSEVIYVIEGEGMMTVNESKFYIGPGDYFRIPKNTYHRLDVISKKYMKVMSVQAPEFSGEDRVYDENDTEEFTKVKNREAGDPK